MSRVGKVVITVPDSVTVECVDNMVSVTGPKGTLLQAIKPCVRLQFNGNKTLEVIRADEAASTKALHGLYNRLIRNMIEGVTKGYVKTLILNGVGYKAVLKGTDLSLALGYSHPCEVKAESGITFKVCTPQEVQALNLGKEGISVVIQVIGIDKEKVGEMAAKIRELRKVEPYHLYGIRYSDERVMRKESKSGKSAGKKK